MTDGNEKNELLKKLVGIIDVVYSDGIIEIYKEMQQMVNTKSGKIYDNIQITISNATIAAVDKQYLLEEVTGWSKKLVWTEDYSKGVSSIVEAWTKHDAESISKAESIINNIQNQYNKDYLLEELTKIKAKYSNTTLTNFN